MVAVEGCKSLRCLAILALISPLLVLVFFTSQRGAVQASVYKVQTRANVVVSHSPGDDVRIREAVVDESPLHGSPVARIEMVTELPEKFAEPSRNGSDSKTFLCMDADHGKNTLVQAFPDPFAFDKNTPLGKWIQQTRATVFKGGRTEDTCKKRSFVSVSPSCGGLGFGNCQLGVMSAIVIAVLTDSIPLIGLRASLLKDTLKFRHGEWNIESLLPCYQKQANHESTLVVAPKKSETIGAMKKLSGSVDHIAFSGYQYFGAYGLMTPRYRNQVLKMLPAALNDTALFFGAYRQIFTSFFEIKEDAMRNTGDILDIERWKIRGPLLVLHLRKGFPSTKHPNADAAGDALHCLHHVITCRGFPEVRVFVATFHRATWEKFRSFFGLAYEGGIASPASVGGARVEFKVSDAVNEQQLRNDQKSVSFFHDWYILSRADIVLMQPHTTFANTAVAVGVPAMVYTFYSSHCNEVFYREACMHDGKSIAAEAAKGDCGLFPSQKSCETLRRYPAYCDSIGR